jgi:hypothetical protein
LRWLYWEKVAKFGGIRLVKKLSGGIGVKYGLEGSVTIGNRARRTTVSDMLTSFLHAVILHARRISVP